MPRTQLIGVVAPAPSGDYDASLSYQILNVVRYGNASYIATQNAPVGATPENTDYWQLLNRDGGGGGDVESVNGQTGVVVLMADDVLTEEQLAAANSGITALMVPSAASSSNQLADKNFVNSSVATNTANFLGSFNVVGDLGLNIEATHAQVVAKLNTTAIIPTKTNNDYVYVYYYNATTTNVDRYERYKYSDSNNSFGYEFTLNNSSFTSDQWAAITSGITSGKVATYDAHVINTTIHITGSERTTWNEKYSKPSSGIPASDLASAVQTSLGKADSAYQKPSGGIPTSDLASTTPVNEVSIDTTPTSGSSNLITSGGVYAYIASLDGNGVAY